MMLLGALVIGVLGLPPAAAADHLGTVVFPTSCSSTVQPTIERGVALLHSFQYEEAAQEFTVAAHRDSSCAMCHWGKAMTLYHQLWDWPTTDALREGQREITRAQQLGAKTARERGYIAAAAAFFAVCRVEEERGGVQDRRRRVRAASFVVALAEKSIAPFPLSAHRTGRDHFGHPALGRVSHGGMRRTPTIGRVERHDTQFPEHALRREPPAARPGDVMPAAEKGAD